MGKEKVRCLDCGTCEADGRCRLTGREVKVDSFRSCRLFSRKAEFMNEFNSNDK